MVAMIRDILKQLNLSMRSHNPQVYLGAVQLLNIPRVVLSMCLTLVFVSNNI